MRKLVKNLFGDITSVKIRTPKFKVPYEQFPLVEMYENFNMADHIPLEESKDKIAEILEQGLSKARLAGIQDEKEGVNMEDGQKAFWDQSAQSFDTMLDQANRVKVNFMEGYGKVLAKVKSFDKDVHIEEVNNDNFTFLEKVQAGLRNLSLIAESNVRKYSDQVKDLKIARKVMGVEAPAERPFINKKGAWIPFIVFLVLPDLSITYYTLQLIVNEGNNFQLFVMTLGLAFSYVWLSDLLGRYLFRKAHKKSLLFGVLGIILIAFMTAIRFMTGASIVFTVLYIILFILGTAFSYIREEYAPYYANVDAENRATTKLHKAIGKEDTVKVDLKANDDTYQVACKKVKKDTEKFDSLIEDNGEDISKRFDEVISGLEVEKTKCKTKIEIAYKEGYKIAASSNPVISNINGASKNGAPIMAWAAIALFTLASCTNPKIKATGVINDDTMETVIENPQVEIKAILKLDREIGRGDGRQFYATEISDRSFGQIYSTEPLVKAEYLTRNELQRTAEINEYEQGCDSILNLSFESMDGKGQKSTHILRNIKRMVQRMDEGGADRKTLILISDLLSNHRRLNLYSYRTKIDSLKKDRDSIADIMNKDAPVDLSGYNIIVVHQPSLVNDELVRAVWHYWNWYFKQHCKAESVRFEQSLI